MSTYRSKHSLLKFYYVLFIAPGLLIYTAIIVFPVFFSVYFSFTEWAGVEKARFVGLDNYKRMFEDTVFLHSLRNNIIIVLVSVLGQIPLGLILAYVVYRKIVRFGQFFQAMIFFPVAISAIIVAILWNQIFAPGGLYTSIIRALTGDPLYVVQIFENKTFAILPILFVILWYYTGVYMVIFIANMRRIPESLVEVALIDGANEKQILFKVITPQMIPVIFTTLIFAISGSLKSFDLIFAMTGGGPAHYTEVIAIYMYYHTFKYYEYGFGSAVSVVIVVLSLVFILFLQKYFKKLEKKYA